MPRIREMRRKQSKLAARKIRVAGRKSAIKPRKSVRVLLATRPESKNARSRERLRAAILLRKKQPIKR